MREKDRKREIALALEEWSSLCSKGFRAEHTITLDTHTHLLWICRSLLCWMDPHRGAFALLEDKTSANHSPSPKWVCVCAFTCLGFCDNSVKNKRSLFVIKNFFMFKRAADWFIEIESYITHIDLENTLNLTADLTVESLICFRKCVFICPIKIMFLINSFPHIL